MNPRLTYRESAVAGASPVRQVILLYEQAIEDLRRALAACSASQATGQLAGQAASQSTLQISARQIEDRTRHINHANLILGYLQSSLDHERGGTVAVHLDRFYNQVRAGLVEAQYRQSPDAIERQISLLVEVHEAWCEVERSEVERCEASSASALRQESPSGINSSHISSSNIGPLNIAAESCAETEINRSKPMPAESAVARPSAEWNA
jgi:flagellin-specific chaperone FliS